MSQESSKTTIRALQVWSVLAWVAQHRQTITYKQLGELIGIPTLGLGPILEPIQTYCEKENLPILTAIVVNADSGLPSDGCNIPPEKATAEFERVFKEKWHKIKPTPKGIPIF